MFGVGEEQELDLRHLKTTLDMDILRAEEDSTIVRPKEIYNNKSVNTI